MFYKRATYPQGDAKSSIWCKGTFRLRTVLHIFWTENWKQLATGNGRTEGADQVCQGQRIPGSLEEGQAGRWTSLNIKLHSVDLLITSLVLQ